MKQTNHRKLLIVLLAIYIAIVTAPMLANGQTTPLSLNEALKMASKKNRELLLQRLEVQQMEEAIKESRSYLLPSLTAAGTYNYYFDRQVIFMRGTVSGEASQPVKDVAVGGKHAVNAYILGKQRIFDASTLVNINYSKALKELSTLELAQLESDLALQISAQFVSLQLIKSELEVYRQSRLRNERALKDARALYMQGKALKLDSISSYIALRNSESHILRLENEYKTGMLQFLQSLGEDNPEINYEIVDDELPEATIMNKTNVEDLLILAQENRKDIQKQALNTSLKQLDVRKTLAPYLPQVDMVGVYQAQLQADNLSTDSYGLPRTSFAGVQMSIPIYSGHRARYQKNQARLEVLKSEIASKEFREAVRKNLSLFLAQQSKFQNQLNIHESKIQAAEMGYSIQLERYKNALGNKLELDDAEVKLREARLDKTNVAFQLKLTRLRILHAIGLLSL
jgi:outer membrane protein TolC